MRFEIIIDDETGIITSFYPGGIKLSSKDAPERYLKLILQAVKETLHKNPQDSNQESFCKKCHAPTKLSVCVDCILKDVMTLLKYNEEPVKNFTNVEKNKQILDIIQFWGENDPKLISNGIKALTPKELKTRRGFVHHLINLIKDKAGRGK